jgi:uncharacterized protein YndB with AHSA1/START domain
MPTSDLTITYTVEESPETVFNAITNVRGWWSEGVQGNTRRLNDVFIYRYQHYHVSKHKLIEVVPNQKVVWSTEDSSLNFINHKQEWNGTVISFEITPKDGRTELRFTHYGLTPACDSYDACSNGWAQYVGGSLRSLITTGKGKPDKKEDAMIVNQEIAIVMTTREVAARYNELAQQEKWFDIQDELFAEDVRSVEPDHSKWLPNAAGKAAVRKKGQDWVSRVEAVHSSATTEPIVTGNHFAVGREKDMTVQGIGRLQVSQIMLYEVKDGKIILEQFFY